MNKIKIDFQMAGVAIPLHGGGTAGLSFLFVFQRV